MIQPAIKNIPPAFIFIAPRIVHTHIIKEKTPPFTKGIAWIQYYKEGQNRVSAIREDLSLVITFEGAVRNVSDFDHGLAYVSFFEGNGIISRHGYYELPYDKRNLNTYEIIIDSSGNILYDTLSHGGHSKITYEEILCHGNGKFVALRHETSMTEDRSKSYNDWRSVLRKIRCSFHYRR